LVTRADVRSGLIAAGTALALVGGPALAGHIADYARDSNKVDGFHASDLSRVVGGSRTGHIEEFQSAGYATVHRARIEAPVKGYVLVWANFSAEWDDSSQPGSFAQLSSRITLDGRRVAPTQHFEISRSTLAGTQTVSLSGAIPVKAGTHRVVLQAKRAGGEALAHLYPRHLQALFVPFGDVGR
jgi:hypothetical protein